VQLARVRGAHPARVEGNAVSSILDPNSKAHLLHLKLSVAEIKTIEKDILRLLVEVAG